MKPRRRLSGRLLIPSCAAFLLLEFVFVTAIILFTPQTTGPTAARGSAETKLMAEKFDALLLGASGIKAVSQRWRTDCDVAATAILDAEAADTAVGIFQGSSPICLHIRLDTHSAHQTAEPAVLNPESLASLRQILAGGVRVALAAPPEWPGLIAVASALDAEGDQTALLVKIIPVSHLVDELASSVLTSHLLYRIVDDQGVSLAVGAAGGQRPELTTPIQKAIKNSRHEARFDKTELKAARIGQTNGSLVTIRDQTAETGGPLRWFLLSLITALLAIGVGAATFIIDRVILARLDTLKRVAQIHSKGRFSVRFKPRDYMPREILSLGLALNEMADSSARQAEALQEGASEETRLLLELHHRVKNNFQVVESLLSLLKKGNPPDKIEHLRFVEDHVRSMAVADRAAYGAHGMRVSVDELISGVIDGLRTTAALSASQVRLELGASLGTLDLDRAVALCLCLAVVAPPYFAALSAPGDLIRISAEVMQPGLLRLLIVGTASSLSPSSFLRERLVQAYLQQLDAMPGSGWRSSDEGGFSILIPRVEDLRVA